MKKTYKRDTILNDDGILVYGYKDKYGFHPCKEAAKRCGFDLQKINRRQLGKEYFYSLDDALKVVTNPKLLIGGHFFVAIDDGFARTKICIGSRLLNDPHYYMTDKLWRAGASIEILKEAFKSIGISSFAEITVEYKEVSTWRTTVGPISVTLL